MEMLDIVDRDDNIIARAEKKEAQSKHLRRRIVHVLVFNEKGEMLLQLRGKKCAYLPGYWATSAGGHVISRETYEEAAKRELKEELGIDINLKFMGKDIYTDINRPGLEMFLATYKTTYEGPFELEKGKVDRIEFFSIKKIKQMAENGGKFHPELLFLLKKHFFKTKHTTSNLDQNCQ